MEGLHEPEFPVGFVDLGLLVEGELAPLVLHLLEDIVALQLQVDLCCGECEKLRGQGSVGIAVQEYFLILIDRILNGEAVIRKTVQMDVPSHRSER